VRPVPQGQQGIAAHISQELAFDSFRDVGEIEGIAFDSDASEMLVLANQGKRIVLGFFFHCYLITN
jgi:hypothetical protein